MTAATTLPTPSSRAHREPVEVTGTAVLDVVVPVLQRGARPRAVRPAAARAPHRRRCPTRSGSRSPTTRAPTRRWPSPRGWPPSSPRSRVVHLDEKGRGRALRAVWSASRRRRARLHGRRPVHRPQRPAAAGRPADLRPLRPRDRHRGSRASSRVVRGAKREVISRGYNLLLRGTLRARFSDAQCGFKAIRADVARRLLPLVEDTGWFFDTELLVLAERAGLRIHEVPVDWVDDPDSRVDIVATAIADLKGIARVGRALATGRAAARRAAPASSAARAARPPSARACRRGWPASSCASRPSASLSHPRLPACSTCCFRGGAGRPGRQPRRAAASPPSPTPPPTGGSPSASAGAAAPPAPARRAWSSSARPRADQRLARRCSHALRPDAAAHRELAVLVARQPRRDPAALPALPRLGLPPAPPAPDRRRAGAADTRVEIVRDRDPVTDDHRDRRRRRAGARAAEPPPGTRGLARGAARRRPALGAPGPARCCSPATAVLYLWDLGASGWANAFYAAAVQAGAQSWKAFFFGSLDAGNVITVDKPPGVAVADGALGAGLRASARGRSSCRRR